MILLLRRASSDFSSFVLIRVVRLTIETNTLTATLAITTLVLYVTFPNDLYYVYTLAIFGKVYSNTLAFPSVLNWARTITETPLHFATPEPQPRALKNDIHILSHSTITRPVDLDNSRDDDTNTDWPLTHPRECHLLPEDPEWMVGMSPHHDERKDEVYGL
ncbi:hypothetical protein H4582DRAFT_970139 [Lactarius indigo]|nr:hypothetical protein H4582DRAFT_970139 [Lactarius indigo]